MTLFPGLFQLSGWGYVYVALTLTHITIASVTLYLHRSQTHRAVSFHPLVSHFFRFWLWLTTGQVTKEWVAVHRKHHATCESREDPHSPQQFGIWKVLFLGAGLYHKEAHERDTLNKYGNGTPDDWIERNLYSRFPTTGPVLMGLVDLLCFGIGPGLLIVTVQMVWIPFWAAGVINGIGHYFGYRNFKHGGSFPNVHESRNIIPIGILIGGEEFHNNHHAHPTSARLASKWWELDIGWMYILILRALGLANVERAT